MGGSGLYVESRKLAAAYLNAQRGNMHLSALSKIPPEYASVLDVTFTAWQEENESSQVDFWHGNEWLDVNIWQDEDDGSWHTAIYPVVAGRTDACTVLFLSELEFA